MKKIVAFMMGDEIPSNAIFVHCDQLRNFYYEIPISDPLKVPKDDHKETIETVIAYLNAKVGSKYTSKSKATTSLIRARLNEGRTLQDFKAVIDRKSDEWLGDPIWSMYLRPQTLFGNKFDGYLSMKSGKEMDDDTFKELDNLMEEK